MLGSSLGILNLPISKCLITLRPKSILEYGCGEGKLGVLCSQLGLPVGKLAAVQKLFQDNDRDNIISRGYTEVIDEDIKEYVARGIPERYELIVAMDVIEHFFYGEAMSIIDYSLYNCDNFLLVWPSRLAQNFGDTHTLNRFDIHKTSFGLNEIVSRFEVIYYVKVSLPEYCGSGHYHLALLRGHMNNRIIPPPII
ncbi:MAG: hypothetical protein WCJ64_05300 [Rhodospirillaceae bacterium]